MLAAPDGIHFSAGNGYGAWVTYLRNHAKYSAANAWTLGQRLRGKLSKKERHTVWYAVPFLCLFIRPRTPGRPGGVRGCGASPSI